MKALTLEKLKDILTASAKEMDMDAHDTKNLVNSAKVAEDAEYHTGSVGTRAYFATEGTIVTSYYWDAPDLFWKWQDFVSDAVKPFNLVLEMINHCEFGMYDD